MGPARFHCATLLTRVLRLDIALFNSQRLVQLPAKIASAIPAWTYPNLHTNDT